MRKSKNKSMKGKTGRTNKVKGRPKMTLEGLPVVDAPKKLAINISASDCKKGAGKNPAACAAARACVRQLAGVVEARVHLGRVYLKTKDKWFRYRTPGSIRSEVISFDRGGGFTPGDYTLTPTEPTNNRYSAGSYTGKPKRRMPYHIVTGVRPHA